MWDVIHTTVIHTSPNLLVVPNSSRGSGRCIFWFLVDRDVLDESLLFGHISGPVFTSVHCLFFSSCAFLGSTCVFQFLSSFLFVSLVLFSLFLRRFVRTLKPVKAAAKICTTFDLAHMNAIIFKIDF